MADKKINGSIEITGKLNPNSSGYGFTFDNASLTNQDEIIATRSYVDSKENLIETTWSNLKYLRDSSQLIPGAFYRITNYVCTTIQENTSSAGHAFDIIVRADDINALNENARATWNISAINTGVNKIEILFSGESTPEAFYRSYAYDGVYQDIKYSAYKAEDDNKFIYIQQGNEYDMTPDISYWTARVFIFFANGGISYAPLSAGNTTARELINAYGDAISNVYINSLRDPYFLNNNLEAWKIKYCLDNDTTRFAWADLTTGKGVIYRMVDEFGNDIPYDFKNILFTSSGKYTNAYTFSYTENSTIKDASLLASKGCYDNIMKEYINSNKQQLNFSVFYSSNTSFNCHSNTFGNNCYSNTFGHNYYASTFGNDCHSNIFGNYCYSNTFGNNCYSNTLGVSCYFNTFGDNCNSNTFGDNCYSNTFGKNCYFNTFSNSCQYSTLGNYCNHINFAQTYCSYNIFEDNCSYIYFTCDDSEASSTNKIQHVHVHLGTSGEDEEAPLIISVPDRNQPFEVGYKAHGSEDIVFTEPIDLDRFTISSIGGNTSSLNTIIINRN